MPDLDVLYLKSSWSRVAHEHTTKQGAYLLSLYGILILMLCCLQHFYTISTSKQPYFMGQIVIIYEPCTCHELEKILSWITLVMRINLPIWASKGPVISILRLWLKHPFNIHAQIALPIDRFKHLYYIVFIDIYM
jgi:hypothetical protein